MNMLARALHYRGRGLSVIPLARGGKNPIINWKEYQQRLPTNYEIRSWWEKVPDANIGIATGVVSGVFVLDCDTKDAAETVRAKGRGVPCAIAGTGNGVHFYYSMPDFAVGNRAKILPGMDIRGTGGYVVAPPSIHPSGRAYLWITDVNLDRPAPDWLLDLLRPQTIQRPPAPAERLQIKHGDRYAKCAFNSEYRAVLYASEGSRNDTLNRACYNLGQLIGDGLLDRSEVENAMLNAALAVGQNEREARATITSGIGDGIANPRSNRPYVAQRR